jgi:NTE family protein/lysophospholipid hydrolase
MYVVLNGQLRVVVEQEDHEHFLRMMRAHETVGEMALLTRQTPTSTIKADQEAEVAKLTKASFERLASTSPDIATTLQRALGDLMLRRRLCATLDSTSLLRDVDAELRRALEAELVVLSLGSEETLFQPGEPSRDMYIVVSGRLRIVLEQDGEEVQIPYEVGWGESIGEIGLLTGHPRTSTAYALRDTTVAKFTRESYERLLEKFPLAMTRTFTLPITELVTRHDQSIRPRADVSLVIALIPARPGVLLTEFAQRLVTSFANLGPTLHLNSHRVDQLLGQQDIAQTAVSEDGVVWDAMDIQVDNWLIEQEMSHHYLIYEADPSLTAWTQRVLRQADRVVIVGHETDDPQPGELEIALKSRNHHRIAKRQSLVLIHRDAQQTPTDTARWLALRHVQDHHHLRWYGERDDMARLARILAGKAVGLVLGGGGVHGAAHIGVLRALEEAGIPIDLICGVSSGSMIACLYAMEYDLPTLTSAFTKLSKTSSLITDMTLPVVALLTGRKDTRELKQLFGDRQFEDLYMPCFVVSSNLSQGRFHVHRAGPLWQGVRASSSAPGILPPVVLDGKLLVDGGVTNNLPLNVMRAHNHNGTVIGVNVMPVTDMPAVYPDGTSIDGWLALLDQVPSCHTQGNMPNIATLLYRIVDVSSYQSVQAQIDTDLADLCLRPPLSHYGFADSSHIDEIIEIGYQYAQQKLANWQRRTTEKTT